jgi:hypothetical protein
MVSFFDFLPKGSSLVFQDYFWVHERLEQLGASSLPPPRRGDAGIAEPSSPPWEGLGEAPPRYDAAYGTKRWTYERMRAVAEVLQSCLGEEK